MVKCLKKLMSGEDCTCVEGGLGDVYCLQIISFCSLCLSLMKACK